MIVITTKRFYHPLKKGKRPKRPTCVYLVHVEHETARAILVWHPDKTRVVWLAKSLVSVRECAARAEVRVRMPAWLAKAEGFAGYEMGRGN